MGNVRIELNSDGVREMLKSQEMKQICEEYGSKAVAKLGEGYVATSRTESTRVFTSVYAESYEAKKENLEQNTILKALR